MKQARARGIRTGPKSTLSREQINYAHELIEDGERREAVAAQLRISRTTLYRALVA
jgi:DNA invertase Pin-like site-specific DNA recombinase